MKADAWAVRINVDNYYCANIDIILLYYVVYVLRKLPLLCQKFHDVCDAISHFLSISMV